MRRRRGRHEGSIYKDTDGRWVGAVSLGYRNGKRARKKLYGKTRAAVQEKMVKVLRDLQQSLPVSTDRQTVAQYLEYWLEHVARPALRPRTYASYRQVIKRHLVPDLGRILLATLSPQRVQQLLNEKASSPERPTRGGVRKSGKSVPNKAIGPRTVNYVRAVLRSALEHAVKIGLTSRNVAKLVSPPKVGAYTPAFLTEAQARAFFELVMDHDSGALFSVALAMGLRLGEALGLRWQDVELDSGKLEVRQAMQAITQATAKAYGMQSGLQAVPLKTARSRRSLQMPEPIVSRLLVHRRRQREARLAAGGEWSDTGLVFTNSIGKPLDPANLRKQFKVLAAEIGLPGLRLHDLRHSCATLLLAQGVSERAIMEILGHSQISLTMNTYTHVLDKTKKDAAQKMAGLLQA